MKLQPAIQESLVALLCYDGDNAAQVEGMLSPRQFDVFYSDIAREAIDYRAKYGEVPGEHTLDLIESLRVQRPQDADKFDAIFDSMLVVKDDINAKYALDQGAVFARTQAVKRSVRNALEALQETRNPEEAVATAEAALGEALNIRSDYADAGGKLSDLDRVLRFLEEDDREPMPTGIEMIDERQLGPRRQAIHTFMAPSGFGKSWWLVHLAKQAHMHSKKVLYVSLEMAETEVWQRIVQSITATTKRKVDVYSMDFTVDERGSLIDMDRRKWADRPSLEDDDIQDVLTKKLKRSQRRGQIIVKNFPTNTLTISQLRAYLDFLEQSQRFIPDLLLVDYGDLLYKDPRTDKRDAIGRNFEDLRGIAVQRNIAVATATQTNRSALTKKVIDADSIAEDYSKVQTSDFVVSYNQTQSERDLGLCRLFQVKGRGDEDKFTVVCSQAYAAGQFLMASIGQAGKAYTDSVGAWQDEDEDDD